MHRVHYGWVVVALVFLTLLTAAAIRSSPGVLMVPLEHELHWSRATISAAVSLSILLYGLMGPFAAALLEWMGVRRTMLAALALLAAGVASSSLMTQPWHMVALWGVVVGAGTGMTALVLGATVSARWFEHRRGLVMGILSASTATGQLVFLPAMAWGTEAIGWRGTLLAIAAVALLVMVPVGLFMRDRPADKGLLPYGATTAPEPPAHVVNPAVRAIQVLGEGVRSKDFWLLAGTFFVCGLSTNGLIGTHLIPACIDHGIPELRAAGLVAAMGVFDLVGTTLSGWLSDRWDNRWLLAWYYGLRGLSLVALEPAFGVDAWGLSAFAVFYGLDWIATVPPTVRLTANCFGPERAGIMFGWIFAAHQLGAAVASSAGGLIRVETGSYLAAFVIAGAACVAASTMSLMIGRKPASPQAQEAIA